MPISLENGLSIIEGAVFTAGIPFFFCFKRFIYYEHIYGPKSEDFNLYWDFIHEFYNHDWVRRIENFAIMLTIGVSIGTSPKYMFLVTFVTVRF